MGERSLLQGEVTSSEPEWLPVPSWLEKGLPARQPLPTWLVVALPVLVVGLFHWRDFVLGPHGNHAWRDADGIGVARGFLYDSWNLFRPRVVQRGGGDGVTGMEFPLLPWLSAVAMRIFGDRYGVARWPVWANLPLLAFAVLQLGRRLLKSEAAARLAVPVLLFQPMVIVHSRKLMPEVVLLSLLCLGAAWAYDALVLQRPRAAWAAGLTLALAAVLKPTFVGMAVPLVWWSLQGLAPKEGRAAQLGRMAVVGGLPLLAMGLWFHHARELGTDNFKLSHDFGAAWTLAKNPEFRGFLWRRIKDNYLLQLLTVGPLLVLGTTLQSIRATGALYPWLLASFLTVFLWGEQNYSHIYYAIPLSIPIALAGADVMSRAARYAPWPRVAALALVAIQAGMGLQQSLPYLDRSGLNWDAWEASVAQMGAPARSAVTDSHTPVVSLVLLRRTGWSLDPSDVTLQKLREVRAEGAVDFIESLPGGWISEEVRSQLPPARVVTPLLRAYALADLHDVTLPEALAEGMTTRWCDAALTEPGRASVAAATADEQAQGLDALLLGAQSGTASCFQALAAQVPAHADEIAAYAARHPGATLLHLDVWSPVVQALPRAQACALLTGLPPADPSERTTQLAAVRQYLGCPSAP